MTKSITNEKGGLIDVCNYLRVVKGWAQLRFSENQLFIKIDGIVFKTLEDESVVAIVGEKQVQRWKGTTTHIASRIHDFLEAFYFFN